jgi:hypothetical protein
MELQPERSCIANIWIVNHFRLLSLRGRSLPNCCHCEGALCPIAVIAKASFARLLSLRGRSLPEAISHLTVDRHAAKNAARGDNREEIASPYGLAMTNKSTPILLFGTFYEKSIKKTCRPKISLMLTSQQTIWKNCPSLCS